MYDDDFRLMLTRDRTAAIERAARRTSCGTRHVRLARWLTKRSPSGFAGSTTMRRS